MVGKVLDSVVVPREFWFWSWGCQDQIDNPQWGVNCIMNAGHDDSWGSSRLYLVCIRVAGENWDCEGYGLNGVIHVGDWPWMHSTSSRNQA